MADISDVTVVGFSDTIAVPTGSTGDVVAVWAADGSASDVTPPDGSWTERATGSGGFAAVWLFTKTRTGSEGSDYQFTFTGAAGAQLIAANLTDCDTSDPVADTAYSSGSGTTLTGNDVTAATADSRLVLVAASITEGELDGPPTGMDEPEPSTDHLKLYDQSVGSGATGNRTTTINTTQNWIAFMTVFNDTASGVTATAALNASAGVVASTVSTPVQVAAALNASAGVTASTVSVPVAIAAAALQAAAAVVASTVSVLVTAAAALSSAAAVVASTVGDVQPEPDSADNFFRRVRRFGMRRRIR